MQLTNTLQARLVPHVDIGIDLEWRCIDDPAILASEALSVSSLVDEVPQLYPRWISKQLLRAHLNVAFVTLTCVSFFCTACMITFHHVGPGQAFLVYLCAFLPAMWHAYLQSVDAYPVLTKSLITSFTYIVGDVLAQYIQMRTQIRLSALKRTDSLSGCTVITSMSPWRYTRSGIVGLVVLGPLAHYYYELMAAFHDVPVICKIAIDQTLYLAFYNTVYYILLGLLTGRSLMDVARKYRSQFWPLLIAGWKLWPAVGLITYSFIPTEHRVLFVDTVELVYSAMLSTVSNDSTAQHTPPTARALSILLQRGKCCNGSVHRTVAQ
eukprot:CAMPEP_0174703182 /NCGR_PEP_ID=MMETSP1094-20130205/7219_1 /TAXON_ID=156173 /ORGANISM="Chrysochromulina brevifilum, Strain UTEX LB 985" /LENGTH=322 /DNA_ID=CAMNT_0015901065 /DNA_START=137 /DNA_END=1105 /DNA_ORIENTATION=+